MGRHSKTESVIVETEKFVDEHKIDSNRRAKDTMDYEQMLMAFIENEFKGGNYC